MPAPAYRCPACSASHCLGDRVCCGRPYPGAPANVCDGCACRPYVMCGADAAGGVTACLCGSCGVVQRIGALCGGETGQPP